MTEKLRKVNKQTIDVLLNNVNCLEFLCKNETTREELLSVINGLIGINKQQIKNIRLAKNYEEYKQIINE